MPIPHKMFAVKITRKDGTGFLAYAGRGEACALWSPGNRDGAVAYKRELKTHGLNAKVVPVLYTEPTLITAN